MHKVGPLRLTPNKSCAFAESEHSWLVIEPESGLFIPRKETDFDGISDLFLNGDKPPTLQGDLDLVDNNIALVSKLLYPFRSSVEESFNWSADCSDHCFSVFKSEQLRAPDQISLDDGIHSMDKDGDLRIPILLTNTSTQIFRSNNNYVIGIPAVMPKNEIVVPDYVALRSPYALQYDDRWVAVESVDGEGKQVQIGESQLLAGVESSQGQQLRLIHLVIGLLLALLVAIGALWLWRGFRMYDRDELDSKNIEHFG